MNPRSLRRLAADHASLHNSALPPNYLFDPRQDPSSDLTALDILLAGPASTPYELGVFKLHLSIPPTYPSDPPKAFFRTKIFHPNIEPETGAVCVETLKRDWTTTLTLRDVLVTISCLLVFPNASSALNAEAGGMLESGGGAGWEGFEKRARMMTRLQAGVPKELRDDVKEAKERGEEKDKTVGTKAADAARIQAEAEAEVQERERQELERKDSGYEDGVQAADKTQRRRRGMGRMREMTRVEDAPPRERRYRTRTSSPDVSPAAASMPPPPPPRPFVMQSSIDDVFGGIRLPHPSQRPHDEGDMDANQENDACKPPCNPIPVFHPGLVRTGPSIPLGELSIADPDTHPDDMDSTFDDSLEAEYPPSPRKSPVKQRRGSEDHYAEHPPSPRKQNPGECPASPRKQSPVKQPTRQQKRNLFAPSSASEDFFAPPPRPNMFKAESSRTAALAPARGLGGGLFFTPDNATHPAMLSTQGHSHTPDAPTETDESEFEMSFELLRQSERKKRNLLSSPPKRKVRSFLDRSVVGGRSTRNAVSDPFGGAGTRSELRCGSGRKDKGSTPALSQTVAASDPMLAAGVEASGIKKSPRTVKSGKSEEEKRRDKLEKRMWKMCGGDIERWNRGDFGGFLKIKAARW